MGIRVGRHIAAALAALAPLAIATPPAAAEAPEVSWQAPVAVARGDGHRGPWRMNESDFDYVDDPTVAINDAGVVAVAWADQARQDLVLQVFEPDGTRRFDDPVNVSRTPEAFSWLPRLRIGPVRAGRAPGAPPPRRHAGQRDVRHASHPRSRVACAS